MAAADLPVYALSFHQGRRGSPLRPLDLLRVEALGVTPVALHLHLQARERYTPTIPAAGSSSKALSRASSAVGPTTSAPPSEGGTDDGDTEMRHQTPYPKDNFMAEPTPLRLVGNYGVAEQDAEAIAAALLTATMWF